MGSNVRLPDIFHRVISGVAGFYGHVIQFDDFLGEISKLVISLPYEFSLVNAKYVKKH